MSAATLTERPVQAGTEHGGVPAWRAVVRWSLRLFRREWRQQLLMLDLLTVAVAVTIWGAGVATNTPPPATATDRTAGLRPQLHVESQEPHRRAGRRPAARRPGRRTSGLRRVAIRSVRRRTMTSKIVVGGLGALTAGGATVIAQANFPDEPAPRARRNPVRQPVIATDDERPCSRCKGEP
jgi:hypothetical protein